MMDNNISQASGQSKVGSLSLEPMALGGGSLQMMFAQLQMQLCEQSKTNAMGYMDQIKATQEEQQKVSAMLNQCRQLQADAKDGKGNCSWDKKASIMPQDVAKYMDENGLAFDTKSGDTSTMKPDEVFTTKDGKTIDLANNKDEWDTAITSLQSKLDSLGTDTQQKMVYVQDFMGQYNSYLQGANSTIQQSNQTLAQLAKVQ
jgi:hypothetical protein